MQPKQIITTILFLTSLIIYYSITAPAPTLTTAQVTKIIDGDTIQLNDSSRVRLLGINTPEKNQPFHEQAKQFLASQVENQTIQIESHGNDKYSRTLAHVFKDSKNINAQILSTGLATLYYYDKDSHYEELMKAEKQARESSLGLWAPSPNSHCIQIIEFKTDEPELLILKNSCQFPLNLNYKDDATHIYKASIPSNSIYQNNFSHIWNTDGDTIYIYDSKGLLSFYRYS